MDSTEHQTAAEAPPVESVRGEWKEGAWSFTHFCQKSFTWFQMVLKKRPALTISCVLALVLTLYAERHLLQPYMLILRIYSGGLLVVVAGAYAGWMLLRHYSVRLKTLGGFAGALLALLVAYGGRVVHDYLALYMRYETLEVVDLPALPTTDHERILPLNAVFTLARERMNETEMPGGPDLVRIGEEYRWTMAVEPAYFWNRLMHSIDEVISVLSTVPSPDMSRRNPERVNFTVGEDLLLSRNTVTCVRRAFGLWQSMSYEPANVIYLKDDAGRWVQVVTLIKWVGLLFPWPEFGGVQVIEQGSTNIAGRILLGCGQWIPPEEVSRHAFLRGQNIIPYEVSRFMAASVRFQAGFFGPLPFSREGDIRIADLPEDVNQQPFTLFFNMGEGRGSKLYHYFALEPYNQASHGLSTSFFVPADGIGSVYAYRHFRHNEAPLGVTAVGDQVRANRRNYDWTRNIPVEHRPYIHPIADSNGRVENRLIWISTVVTVRERRDPSAPLEFISGSEPEIAATDAYRGNVVWLDRRNPQGWPDELRVALGAVWSSH